MRGNDDLIDDAEARKGAQDLLRIKGLRQELACAREEPLLVLDSLPLRDVLRDTTHEPLAGAAGHRKFDRKQDT